MNEKELQLPALIFFPQKITKPAQANRRYFAESRFGNQHEIEKIGPREWVVNIEPGHDATFQTLRDAKAWIQWTPELRQA